MSASLDRARRGPFINEDGDVWVPVEGVGGIARAIQIAREATWGRAHFEGMEDARMTLHEATWEHTDGIDGDGDEDAAIEACDDTTEAGPCTWTGRAYHFRDVD